MVESGRAALLAIEHERNIDPAIATLLSPQARITHQRKRLMMSKSIVELEGEQYVLHRFRRHATFERFLKLMRQVSEAGATVQRIAAVTATADQQRQHGYYVALDYVPGTPFGPKPTATTLASFAQNLARLHSVEGPDNEAPFAAARPKLPHKAYLRANPDLSIDERNWIRASLVRLKSIRANNLTHGDLYAANIILGSDGRVSLIDYELMAFERAGVELGIALLRSFCRHADGRRLLLETYLKHCSATVAQAWQTHWADFLFAAAARLALQRKRRYRNLTLTNHLLKVPARLLRSGNSDLGRRMDRNESLRRTAHRRAAYYGHVAKRLVHFGLATPTLDPLEVLNILLFKEGRDVQEAWSTLQ